MTKRGVSHSRLLSWYEDGPRQWGESFLRRNHWKVAGMCSREDLEQDAKLIYIRCFRYWYTQRTSKKTKEEIFKIYKRSMYTLLLSRSQQCFPNPYAYIEDQGRTVVSLDDYNSPVTTVNELEACLTYFSGWLASLPKELSDALRLIIEDFCGDPCINQRESPKLDGKVRKEPFEIALARKAGLDLDRDVVGELATAMNLKEHK